MVLFAPGGEQIEMQWCGMWKQRGRGGAGLSGRADAGSGGGEGWGFEEGMGGGGDPTNTQYMNRQKSWHGSTCGGATCWCALGHISATHSWGPVDLGRVILHM